MAHKISLNEGWQFVNGNNRDIQLVQIKQVAGKPPIPAGIRQAPRQQAGQAPKRQTGPDV